MQSLQPDFWNAKTDNLLPREGIVEYMGRIFDPAESAALFSTLLSTIAWKNDEVVMFGTTRTLPRKVAWHGEAGFTYAYSGTRKTALPWTPALSSIKERVEKCAGTGFNSCLLNLYHDGTEGMGWHSDDERTLGENPVIASVSFGDPKQSKQSKQSQKSKEIVSVLLEHGSLLVMKGATQHHWVHAMPKTKKITAPRINLTFRFFVGARTASGHAHTHDA